MDQAWRDRFLGLWRRHFRGSEPPLGFYYTERPPEGSLSAAPRGHRCLVCDLAAARGGRPRAFDADSLGCGGARRYLGFTGELQPGIEHFLSCGIPGEMEGERYTRSPELARRWMEKTPSFEAPAEYAVFRRLDGLEPREDPPVYIFFAPPDVLSGLFTLANFGEADPTSSVIAPAASGCAAIAAWPYAESLAGGTRAVLGMFDVSARPCVRPEVLTLAVTREKLRRMAADMEESFLITRSWEKVRRRLAAAPPEADAK